MLKTIVVGFVAGFIALLVFHQGTAFLLYTFGNDIPSVVSVFGRTNAPFNTEVMTKPLGVPLLWSQAFWGGVWGMVLASILRRARLPDLAFGAVFGALALTIIAVTLVPYLKGMPTWNGAIPWRGLLYNGAWGWGTALLLRPLLARG